MNVKPSFWPGLIAGWAVGTALACLLVTCEARADEWDIPESEESSAIFGWSTLIDSDWDHIEIGPVALKASMGVSPDFRVTTLTDDSFDHMMTGTAAVAWFTIDAQGTVYLLNEPVPRSLGVRWAGELARLGCHRPLDWTTVWLLWDTLIDEAGRSARTWREP